MPTSVRERISERESGFPKSIEGEGSGAEGLGSEEGMMMGVMLLGEKAIAMAGGSAEGDRKIYADAMCLLF